MSTWPTALGQLLVLVALLAAVHVPLGSWMATCYQDSRHWRLERWIYRAVGVDADAEQPWKAYAASVVAFAVVGVLLLWALAGGQTHLPLLGARTGQDWHTALNTAVSFVTNTNWQSYGGESGASPLVGMLGLTVQNFVSAATGMAVAIAVVRGIARQQQETLGNFWVDLVRSCVRILLPLATLGALALLACGVVQNLAGPHLVETLAGGHQAIPGGPVASEEAIKLLGTNGGGIFNANSAHPFENPNPLANLIEIFLVLCIPFSLPWTYGRLVGDRRQARPVLAVMSLLFVGFVLLSTWAEMSAARGATGALEGKEIRFGVAGSMLFGSATTGTSTGAVNAMHDSMSALGGGLMMFGMQLGEISPGGVGTGLYSILVLAILTVFLAGLMVGRTPELLGKQIGRAEITLGALYILVMPALVLVFTAISLVLPAARDALQAVGPHGLSEMLYAYTSAANNNGSAFGGISADQPWLNLTLAACMFLGRFVPIVAALALAGSLARQQRRPVSNGTMPTHTPLFGVLLLVVTLIVAGLTFFPALALGPLAEALS